MCVRVTSIHERTTPWFWRKTQVQSAVRGHNRRRVDAPQMSPGRRSTTVQPEGWGRVIGFDRIRPYDITVVRRLYIRTYKDYNTAGGEYLGGFFFYSLDIIY